MHRLGALGFVLGELHSAQEPCGGLAARVAGWFATAGVCVCVLEGDGDHPLNHWIQHLLHAWCTSQFEWTGVLCPFDNYA